MNTKAFCENNKPNRKTPKFEGEGTLVFPNIEDDGIDSHRKIPKISSKQSFATFNTNKRNSLTRKSSFGRDRSDCLLVNNNQDFCIYGVKAEDQSSTDVDKKRPNSDTLIVGSKALRRRKSDVQSDKKLKKNKGYQLYTGDSCNIF